VYVFRISRELCRRACGNIVEFHHIRGKLPAQLVNARHQGFEMIAILDAGVLRDLLQTFAFKANEVYPQDGIVIKCGSAPPMRCARAAR
jgi:hypothetical protein